MLKILHRVENQFAKTLVDALKVGHKVTYNLIDKDIDIILMIDPRSYNDGVTFGSFEIIKYLILKNKNALVIHRINECDEERYFSYEQIIEVV